MQAVLLHRTTFCGFLLNEKMKYSPGERFFLSLRIASVLLRAFKASTFLDFCAVFCLFIFRVPLSSLIYRRRRRRLVSFFASSFNMADRMKDHSGTRHDPNTVRNATRSSSPSQRRYSMHALHNSGQLDVDGFVITAAFPRQSLLNDWSRRKGKLLFDNAPPTYNDLRLVYCNETRRGTYRPTARQRATVGERTLAWSPSRLFIIGFSPRVSSTNTPLSLTNAHDRCFDASRR